MIVPGLRVVAVDGGLIDRVLTSKYANEVPRTGMHCSSIVDDMLRRLWPSKYDTGAITPHERVLYFEAGNAFEHVMARQLRRTILGWRKPEPRRYGGIWFSPDGWNARSRTIDEIKFTWTSRRDFLDSVKFLGYLYQGLSYAHVWRADRLRFHVLFVNGDYRSGKKPHAWTFTCRWADANVPREQFRTIRRHAVDLGWLDAKKKRAA